MNINVSYFDNTIIVDDDLINVIEIENKRYFYRFVSDLNQIIHEGYSDCINFFNKDNELNMNNKIKLFVDIFNLGLESKKYDKDINKVINESITSEDKDNIISQYKKLVRIYNKVLNNVDLPLIIENDCIIEDITKSMKISINGNDELLGNLLLLIDLERLLNTKNIIIFINLKQYLTKDELIELYKYSIYNHIKIILIDSQSYGCPIDYEKKFIIDENLEEYML